ncbi:methyltransferase domain-containing protein [Ruminococcus bicirculans (ex Wegman et al. 2014)]|uniref:methyltransferase domain-containing protein n=1 Tax=Ruminococcus bicirculans (ex Wegman et al. 2014) TaxID=1160721 RepID=UPI00325B4343
MFRVIYMYVCPICKKRLRKLDNVWHCQNGHSFDIARKAYVNLLTTKGRNPKNAGDNAEMVKARTDFLDRDYYLPLAKKTAEVMGGLLENVKQPYIIDSGCGEGFYTVNYAKALPKAKFYGIDISKAAVAHCMTRIHCENITNCEFAVASSFQLPFIDKFADLIVCTFAPVSNDEYARVLKDGGKLVVVSPSPRHLFELKEVLYEKPYENKPNVYGLNKFDESEEMIFEYPVVLESHEDIFNLFTMTPYYYKTSAEAVEKLKKVNRLELTCGFSIRTFTKKRGF